MPVDERAVPQNAREHLVERQVPRAFADDVPERDSTSRDGVIVTGPRRQLGPAIGKNCQVSSMRPASRPDEVRHEVIRSDRTRPQASRPFFNVDPRGPTMPERVSTRSVTKFRPDRSR